MPFTKIKDSLSKISLSPTFGAITSVSSTNIIAEGLKPCVQDIVKITKQETGQSEYGMVSELTKDEGFCIFPFGHTDGLKKGDKVFIDNKGLQIPISDKFLGRVINPLGKAIDGKGYIREEGTYPIIKSPIAPLKRGIIDEAFPVGIKSIDSLLTCGKGQKVGIMAGSGVGKSTLIGMITKGCKASIKVIALIGERGREVPEFIQKNLQNNLQDCVIVVATSDDSALMRKYGAFSAMSIAEYFKDKGKDVLFIMDSVTRFAMAQRDIGLSLGEPPTSKGYPPSVFTLLPQLMERAGKEEGKGSISAFFTVLTEGDDINDPVSDQSRSILDGHIVLNRDLVDSGIYPPIDILSSLSRVMGDVVDEEHLKIAQKFRRLYSLLKENEVLLRIGAYVPGSDKELDEAVSKKEQFEEFLRQDMKEIIDFRQSQDMLKQIIRI